MDSIAAINFIDPADLHKCKIFVGANYSVYCLFNTVTKAFRDFYISFQIKKTTCAKALSVGAYDDEPIPLCYKKYMYVLAIAIICGLKLKRTWQKY